MITDDLMKQVKEMATPMVKMILMVLDIKVPDKVLSSKIDSMEDRIMELADDREFQKLMADVYIGIGKTCTMAGESILEVLDKDEEK